MIELLGWLSEGDALELSILTRRTIALSQELGETNTRAMLAYREYVASGFRDVSQAQVASARCVASAALLKEIAELIERMSRFAPTEPLSRPVN
jgi:hypothetical protein